ncbi:MAG: hypothetical protein ACPGK1_11320, partial [bacterium]
MNINDVNQTINVAQTSQRQLATSNSKDGKELVVIEKEDCNKPINQKQCYKLSNLDFQKALKTPQTPN